MCSAGSFLMALFSSLKNPEICRRLLNPCETSGKQAGSSSWTHAHCLAIFLLGHILYWIGSCTESSESTTMSAMPSSWLLRRVSSLGTLRFSIEGPKLTKPQTVQEPSTERRLCDVAERRCADSHTCKWEF